MKRMPIETIAKGPLLSCHQVNAPLGKGRCSVAARPDQHPAIFCNRPAYGVQHRSIVLEFNHNTVGLVCAAHGGPLLREAIAGRTVIRFDGPPAHESGRFIEVDRDGASIAFGEWVQDGDDWLLVLPEAVESK